MIKNYIKKMIKNVGTESLRGAKRRGNPLKIFPSLTLSRICKFASSLTNSTLSQRERVCAFTLAEVLITLGIIGVVAALTLPTLIGNYQKQALATQTRKFYSMMSQAVKQYMADEGVDDLRNTPLTDMSNIDDSWEAAQKACDDFIKKYLKVAKVCEDGCLADNYRTQTNEISNTVGKLAEYSYRISGKFVLADGAVLTIGHGCSSYPISLYVDVNGKKGPNKIGYDLWSMDIFYDGSIDEGGVNPECKRGTSTPEYGALCGELGTTPEEAREYRFNQCKGDASHYGGCFGHFLNNNFTFDY